MGFSEFVQSNWVSRGATFVLAFVSYYFYSKTVELEKERKRNEKGAAYFPSIERAWPCLRRVVSCSLIDTLVTPSFRFMQRHKPSRLETLSGGRRARTPVGRFVERATRKFG